MSPNLKVTIDDFEQRSGRYCPSVRMAGIWDELFSPFHEDDIEPGELEDLEIPAGKADVRFTPYSLRIRITLEDENGVAGQGNITIHHSFYNNELNTTVTFGYEGEVNENMSVDPFEVVEMAENIEPSLRRQVDMLVREWIIIMNDAY